MPQAAGKNQTINLVSADSAQNGPSHLYNQQYYNKSVRPKNILKDLPFIITQANPLFNLGLDMHLRSSPRPFLAAYMAY